MTQLTISRWDSQMCDQDFFAYSHFVGNLPTITSLHIAIHGFFTTILTLLFQSLPHLDTLTLILSGSSTTAPFSQDQLERIDAVSKINHIVRINIKQHVLWEHIDILINLCPQMQFLRIQCENYSHMECLLRLILIRRKSSLSSLHFVIANADESMVIQLKTLIFSEKLLERYEMQRKGDQIALYW